MDTQRLFPAIVAFAGLTLAGVFLIVMPQAQGPDLVRSVLPFVGSAMFAAGLAFFLVESFNYARR